MNVCKAAAISSLYSVLIDTWWNVNEAGERIVANKDGVLIDTWWNVNKDLKAAHSDVIEF